MISYESHELLASFLRVTIILCMWTFVASLDCLVWYRARVDLFIICHRVYQVAYLSSKIVVVARRPSYKGNNAMQLLLLFVVDYKCHHEYFIRSGLPISTY